MSDEENFMFNAAGRDEQLTGYLLPFASQERQLVLSLCQYALAALEGAALGDRSRDQRINDGEFAVQATKLMFQLAVRVDDAALLIRPGLNAILQLAGRLVLERLKSADDLLDCNERAKEVKFVRHLACVVDEIVRSDKFEIEVVDAMSEIVFELEQASNQFAVQISNPARYEFEWVHDAEISLGAEAHSIALSLSYTRLYLWDRLRTERHRGQ